QYGQYRESFTDTQMRHYFYKVPPIYIWLFFIGVLVSTIGTILALNAANSAASSQSYPYYAASSPPSFFGSFPMYIVGLGVVLLLWGGIPLLANSDRPNSEEYRRWIIKKSQPLYKKALQRLHLDESQCESIIEIQGGISSLQQLTKKFPEKEIV